MKRYQMQESMCGPYVLYKDVSHVESECEALRTRLAEAEAQRDKLQDENEKLRGLMSIEADKHNERQILLQNTMEQLEELKVSLP